MSLFKKVEQKTDLELLKEGYNKILKRCDALMIQSFIDSGVDISDLEDPMVKELYGMYLESKALVEVSFRIMEKQQEEMDKTYELAKKIDQKLDCLIP